MPLSPEFLDVREESNKAVSFDSLLNFVKETLGLYSVLQKEKISPESVIQGLAQGQSILAVLAKPVNVGKSNP